MAGGPELAVGDHVRSRGGGLAAGVYRVVGVGEAAVTLLRVTDADGRRRVTGQIETVDWSTASLDPAPNPDAGFRPFRWLRERVQGTVWAVRMVTGL